MNPNQKSMKNFLDTGFVKLSSFTIFCLQLGEAKVYFSTMGQGCFGALKNFKNNLATL